MPDDINTLRELIEENRFLEARRLLLSINHPQKAEWLAEIETRQKASDLQFIHEQSELTGDENMISRKNKRHTLDDIDRPKPKENPFKSFVRVIFAGIFATLLISLVMILLDMYLMKFSEYLMQEMPENLLLGASFFCLLFSFLFASLVRLIVGGKGFLAGMYHVFMMIVTYLLWNYFSFSLRLGFGINGLLNSENLNAYSVYIDEIPNQSVLAFLFAATLSLMLVHTLGSLNDKELKALNRRYGSGRITGG